MNWLKRLDGTHRSASGWEWRIWRKLPLIALLGTLLPAMLWIALNWMMDPQSSPEQARWIQMAGYVALGTVVFHWTMVLTVAIGCVVVFVMKGPAYAADSYPVPHSDYPLAHQNKDGRMMGRSKL
jgi:magnesium-transporting ATPase (P-type)